MSVVTTVLMTTGALDTRMLEDVNRHFETREFPVRGLADVTRDAGGSKAAQANVWLGAYNHFDEAPFFKHLKSLKWAQPEAVRIYFNREHDDGFSISCYFLDGFQAPLAPEPWKKAV